jgi:hypothetical protein
MLFVWGVIDSQNSIGYDLRCFVTRYAIFRLRTWLHTFSCRTHFYVVSYYVVCIGTGDKLPSYCCAWSPEPNRLAYFFFLLLLPSPHRVTPVVFYFVENRTWNSTRRAPAQLFHYSCCPLAVFDRIIRLLWIIQVTRARRANAIYTPVDVIQYNVVHDYLHYVKRKYALRNVLLCLNDDVVITRLLITTICVVDNIIYAF